MLKNSTLPPQESRLRYGRPGNEKRIGENNRRQGKVSDGVEEAEGRTVVSMKNDWKRIFAFEQ